MHRDNIFQMAASNIRFGAGCTAEIGMDLRDMSAKRIMVLVDPNVRSMPVAEVVIESLKGQQLDYVIFDEISIEHILQVFLASSLLISFRSLSCYLIHA